MMTYGIVDLHSNMFLLRQTPVETSISNYLHLHSNMFLLRPSGMPKCSWDRSNLHSNMFLLRRFRQIHFAKMSKFTFQYVSIKTGGLLKQQRRAAGFTFQYVSIKTYRLQTVTPRLPYLHSNMFLLRHITTLRKRYRWLIYIPICFY